MFLLSPNADFVSRKPVIPSINSVTFLSLIKTLFLIRPLLTSYPICFTKIFPLLIEADNWPERPDDVEWQQQIISALTRYASPEHIDAVKQNVGAKRFRPEEVAAGVISEIIPLDFSIAHALAQEILQDLSRSHPIR